MYSIPKTARLFGLKWIVLGFWQAFYCSCSSMFVICRFIAELPYESGLIFVLPHRSNLFLLKASFHHHDEPEPHKKIQLFVLFVARYQKAFPHRVLEAFFPHFGCLFTVMWSNFLLIFGSQLVQKFWRNSPELSSKGRKEGSWGALLSSACVFNRPKCLLGNGSVNLSLGFKCLFYVTFFNIAPLIVRVKMLCRTIRQLTNFPDDDEGHFSCHYFL